jgi:hypothetical protein
MFRTSRTIASLIRSLTLGVAATVATATLATSVVGCQDESQPEYWTKKLEKKEWRPRAIKRLDQFFQDSLTTAPDPGPKGTKLDDPKVKGLVDKIIDPLVKTYIDGYDELDSVSRVMAIKLIAAFRDKRGEPAFKKALDDFVARPKTKVEDQDIKWAIRAQGDLKLPSLSPLVMQVFQKLEAHSLLGGITYKDLNDTMLDAPDKAWVEPLKAMLQADIKAPNQKDKSSFDKVRDQLFWQPVACMILGEIGDPSAVPAIMKVILDPNKGDVATTAVLALVKIGKPSVDAAIKLLKGESKDLVDFHVSRLMKAADLKEPPKDEPATQLAAVILGAVGRPEGLPPMLALIKSTDKPVLKAVLLREIAKIPATAESKTTFKEVFEKLPDDTQLPPRGGKALPQLIEDSVVRFHDSTMIDWLLERAEKTKGLDAETKKDLQATILTAAMKLAKPNQLQQVGEALKKYGTEDKSKKNPNIWWSGYYEGPLYSRADELMKSCGTGAACYLENIKKTEAQSKDADKQFLGIKAAYMLAAFGDEGTASQIVKAMPDLENAAVRFAAAQAIDYVLPKGSAKVADQLDELIKKNAKTGDKDKMSGDQPLKEVMYRVRTRAK